MILAGWEKFACSELLNILMDCLTDEVKADKTRLNTVLPHFLERVSSNDLDLSPSAIEYIVRDSSVLDHTGAVVDLTAGAVVGHTCAAACVLPINCDALQMPHKFKRLLPLRVQFSKIPGRFSDSGGFFLRGVLSSHHDSSLRQRRAAYFRPVLRVRVLRGRAKI